MVQHTTTDPESVRWHISKLDRLRGRGVIDRFLDEIADDEERAKTTETESSEDSESDI